MFALQRTSRLVPLRAARARTITKSAPEPTTFGRVLREVLGDDAATIERLIATEPSVTDVVLDAGRAPVVYFSSKEPPCTVSLVPIEGDTLTRLWTCATDSARSGSLADETSRTGTCPSRPLDRLSKMHHYDGSISGLTWRVAHHDEIEVPTDLRLALVDRQHTLVYGPPGSGKTTLLRAVAKYCSDHLKERVVVVDATGELGGYHPAGNVLGFFARRMCVPPGSSHDATIMDAIRNHTPQTIVVDEIVTRADAAAVYSAAARGVRVIATTHATSLGDVVQNPVFRAMVGNIQDATVTDARAKSANGKKCIRERTSPATFAHAYGVHTREMETDMSRAIDRLLSL